MSKRKSRLQPLTSRIPRGEWRTPEPVPPSSPGTGTTTTSKSPRTGDTDQPVPVEVRVRISKRRQPESNTQEQQQQREQRRLTRRQRHIYTTLHGMAQGLENNLRRIEKLQHGINEFRKLHRKSPELQGETERIIKEQQDEIRRLKQKNEDLCICFRQRLDAPSLQIDRRAGVVKMYLALEARVNGRNPGSGAKPVKAKTCQATSRKTKERPPRDPQRETGKRVREVLHAIGLTLPRKRRSD